MLVQHIKHIYACLTAHIYNGYIASPELRALQAVYTYAVLDATNLMRNILSVIANPSNLCVQQEVALGWYMRQQRL